MLQYQKAIPAPKVTKLCLVYGLVVKERFTEMVNGNFKSSFLLNV